MAVSESVVSSLNSSGLSVHGDSMQASIVGAGRGVSSEVASAVFSPSVSSSSVTSSSVTSSSEVLATSGAVELADSNGSDSDFARGDRTSSRTQTASVAHLWVSSGPFFETVLFFYCSDRDLADATLSGVADIPLTVKLFDPDGAQFNTVKLFISPHRPAAIELEPFMGGCKIESGIKHAHAAVELPAGWHATSRIVTREASCVLGAASRLTSTSRAFFPVVLSKERFPMVVLLNRSSIEATVRARLFCGKRSPEAVWNIPARGVRVMSVTHEFGEVLAAELEDQVQAYLRLGVRGDYEIDAQMIERLQGPKEGSLYVAVT